MEYHYQELILDPLRCMAVGHKPVSEPDSGLNLYRPVVGLLMCVCATQMRTENVLKPRSHNLSADILRLTADIYTGQHNHDSSDTSIYGAGPGGRFFPPPPPFPLPTHIALCCMSAESQGLYVTSKQHMSCYVNSTTLPMSWP